MANTCSPNIRASVVQSHPCYIVSSRQDWSMQDTASKRHKEEKETTRGEKEEEESIIQPRQGRARGCVWPLGAFRLHFLMDVNYL